MKKTKKKQPKALRKEVALIQEMRYSVMGMKYARVFELQSRDSRREPIFSSASLWRKDIIEQEGFDGCDYAYQLGAADVATIHSAAKKGFIRVTFSSSSSEGEAVRRSTWYAVTVLGEEVAAGK
jgi:hypothetical protein